MTTEVLLRFYYKKLSSHLDSKLMRSSSVSWLYCDAAVYGLAPLLWPLRPTTPGGEEAEFKCPAAKPEGTGSPVSMLTRRRSRWRNLGNE
jgi:hypothetical protein